jgi:hypothetical protein
MSAAAKLARIVVFGAPLAAALAGCHGPFDTGKPDMDYIHSQSWQAAQAMRGKEYIFVARAMVCADKSDVALGPQPNPSFPLPHAPDCQIVTTGRFRVVDALLMRNGTTLLQIDGDGVTGYMSYEIFLPRPYKSVETYFSTGR